MSSGSDKVEKGVDTVVLKPWLPLDSTIHSQNIIVLSLDIADDITEASGQAYQFCFPSKCSGDQL